MGAATGGTIPGPTGAAHSTMTDHGDHASEFLGSNATFEVDEPATNAGSRLRRGRRTGEVDPEPSTVGLERCGGFVVAVPKQDRPASMAATVEDEIEAARNHAIAGQFHSDHERLEARSLALHSAIVRKIDRDPDLLLIPKRNLKRWRARTIGPAPIYLDEWGRILRKPWAEIAEFLVSRSEDAIRLRQSSPFAGVLTAVERKRIYDGFRR